MKRRVHELLQAGEHGGVSSRVVDVFFVALIILNVVAMILETVESCRRMAPRFFAWFEAVSVFIFTIEYAFRLWSCTVTKEYRQPVFGRIRFMFTPLAIVDLLSIIPFYLPFLGVDLRSLRVVRLFRAIRILKFGRYSEAMKITGRAVASRGPELVTTLFLLLVLVLLLSSLMYYAEHEKQPETFSSIPASMWWAVATLSTVGYGDVYPLTPVGKLMASIIAVLGIGMFALPAGILGAAFVEEINRAPEEKCPHCGKSLGESFRSRSD